MHNKAIRKIIASGAYRVLSRVRLNQECDAVMLVDDLIRRLYEEQRTLKKVTPKEYLRETVAVVEGLQDAEIRRVQLPTDNIGQKESIIVDVVSGLGDVSVSMVAVSNQGDLLHEGTVDETILKALDEKVLAMSEEMLESVNQGNRVAEALVKNSVSSDALDEMVKEERHPETVREVASRAKGSRRDIELPTGTVTVGGGLPVPRQVPVEGDFLLERCVVVDLPASGRAVVRMMSVHPVLSEYGLQKGQELNVEVLEDSPEMQILDFARVARVPIDLLVMVTETVSNEKMRAKVVEVKKHDQIVEHVIMKLTELKGEF